MCSNDRKTMTLTTALKLQDNPDIKAFKRGKKIKNNTTRPTN